MPSQMATQAARRTQTWQWQRQTQRQRHAWTRATKMGRGCALGRSTIQAERPAIGTTRRRRRLQHCSFWVEMTAADMTISVRERTLMMRTDDVAAACWHQPTPRSPASTGRVHYCCECGRQTMRPPRRPHYLSERQNWRVMPMARRSIDDARRAAPAPNQSAVDMASETQTTTQRRW
jgi:hypothetical protein